MFYSHQLLARKAPLGQIWMAATLHSKFNRRKLNKLNIIKICEEILNPSVPMALRLSGILMGGVVIVYERKVKLLYDDVTRLLVEINESWKVKPCEDVTVLPRGRIRARREAVTKPDNEDTDIEGMESLRCSNATASMRFEHTGYVVVNLDQVEEQFINHQNEREEDLPFHQADPANIIYDPFNLHQENSSLHHFFESERFDDQMDFDLPEVSRVPTQLPEGLRISTPEEPHQADGIHDLHPEPPSTHCLAVDEIPDLHPEPQNNQQSDEYRADTHQARQDEERPRPKKRRAIRKQHLAMDYEQTIIPGHVYQSWLQHPSNIVSRRGRNLKHKKPMSRFKMAHLMELPPLALISGLPEPGTREIHYPTPFLELWQKCGQLRTPHDSLSGRTSPPQPPPSSSAPLFDQDPLQFPNGDFHSGVGSQPKQPSMEKQMAFEFPVNEEYFPVNGIDFTSASSACGITGDNGRQIPSSGSGNGSVPDAMQLEPEIQLVSGRPNGKRTRSSSSLSGTFLTPVDGVLPTLHEENHVLHREPNLKIGRKSERGPYLDQDMLVETGPTQTQHPSADHPVDNKITDEIRRHLKTHFDTPGAPQTESLDQLTSGMNKKKAAQLFYQTCVLATFEYLKVQQAVPYGEILISKGPKM